MTKNKIYIVILYLTVLLIFGCSNPGNTPSSKKTYTYEQGKNGGLVGITEEEQGTVYTNDYLTEIVIVPKNTYASIYFKDDTSWNSLSEINANGYNYFFGVFLKERKVKLTPFVMSKYEITKDLYSSILKDNEYGISGDPTYSTSYASRYKKRTEEQDSLRAVEDVTWYDAIYFCNLLSLKNNLEPYYIISNVKTAEKNINNNKIIVISSADVFINSSERAKYGYRLPTEAEWEFAARGGNPNVEAWFYGFSGTNLSKGKKITDNGYLTDAELDVVGWYSYNSNTGSTGDYITPGELGYGAHQIGLKTPNTLGLCDMSGNVKELCWDCFDYTDITVNDNLYLKDDFIENPLGISQSRTLTDRVVKGGSWNLAPKDASVLFRYGASGSSDNVGFRVVRYTE